MRMHPWVFIGGNKMKKTKKKYITVLTDPKSNGEKSVSSISLPKIVFSKYLRVGRCCGRMVVWFTTICAIIANHH
jgi:hypothetical protein